MSVITIKIKLIMKKTIMQVASLIIMASLLCMTPTRAFSQEDKKVDYRTLEDLQDENTVHYTRIYRVVNDYPDFKYKYIYDDGKVEDVKIEGIDNEMDREKVRVLILDFKKNKERMKNIPTRTGVYYSVDQEAEPENGYDEFHRTLQTKIDYPKEAVNWPIEGTIYVNCVVSDKGEILYAKAEEDIETVRKRYLEQMKESSEQAVMESSGNWEPAKVDGEPVASWVIVPVVFNAKTHPSLPVRL